MPGAVGSGLIWGVMAIGLYITYKVLDYADLTVTVDGAPVEVSGLLIGGNYYVSAQTINALLGIQAVETDGVLTFSDK